MRCDPRPRRASIYVICDGGIRNLLSPAFAGSVESMAGSKTMLRFATTIMMLSASACCAVAWSSFATEHPRKVGNPPAALAIVQPAPAPERGLVGNPLATISLGALSDTRDRPIFSASRRPPPPAVAPAAAPRTVVAPKPKEPERPPFSLVGTIIGGNEGFGIFLEQSTQAALRLKLGEDYQGWRLRSVRGREVILGKDQQTVVLVLPEPGAGQVPAEAQTIGEARSPPTNLAARLSETAPPGPGPETRLRRRDR